MLTPKVEETILYVRGVEKTTVIYVMADSHLNIYDETEHPYAQNYFEHARNWFHQNWSRTDEADPEDIFDAQVEAIQAANPDYTVLAGDMICGPAALGIAKLKSACRKLGKCMYIPGNHDWQISDGRRKKPLVETYTAPSKEEAVALFGDIVTPEEFQFQVQEVNGVLLIGMDNSQHQFYDRQITLLKEQLETGKPCILFFHIPLYTEGLWAVSQGWSRACIPEEVAAAIPENIQAEIYPTKESLEMLELLQKPDTPIQAIFAGHVHFTHQAPLKNGLMQYVMDMSINGTIRKITILPVE